MPLTLNEPTEAADDSDCARVGENTTGSQAALPPINWGNELNMAERRGANRIALVLCCAGDRVADYAILVFRARTQHWKRTPRLTKHLYICVRKKALASAYRATGYSPPRGEADASAPRLD